jgi:hypothetical protein
MEAGRPARLRLLALPVKCFPVVRHFHQRENTMAEPIRRVAPPAYRRPAPRPRLRSVPPIAEETAAEPARPSVTITDEIVTRRERQPVAPAPSSIPEKRLRGALQLALALHLAAVLAPLLAPSLVPALSRSDALLASAVLLAGATALALGSLGRRA